MAVELATAYVSIVPSTRGMKGMLQDQVSGPVTDVGKREGGRFGAAIAGAAGKALKVGAAGAIAGFGTALFKGFNRLQAIDDAQFKLQGLGHDAAAVQTIMDSALAAVEGTAFGLGEAATIAAGAVASGIDPGDELTRVLSLTGDAASIAGVGLDEMGSIFGKVAAGNRMMTEEMNQLQDRGLPVLAWLQDELGVTAEQVREMVSSGEVDFATFTKIIEDNIGGAALTAGESFRGSLANTGAAIGRLGAALLGPAFERAPAFLEGITAGIDRLTTVIGPAVSTAIEWIRNLGGSLGGDGEMAGRLAGLRDSFASIWASISSIVRGTFDIIMGIIGPSIAGIQLIWRNFGDEIMTYVSFVFDNIVNIIDTVLGVVAGIIEVFAGALTGDWSRAWDGIKAIFESVWNGIMSFARNFWDSFGAFITRQINNLITWFRELPGRIVSALGNLGRALYNAGRDMVQGLLDGAGSLLRSIGRFFLDKLPGWIRGPFERVMGISSPSKVFAGYGEAMGEGLVSGLAGTTRFVSMATRDLALAAQAEVEPVLSSLTGPGQLRVQADAPPVGAAAGGTVFEPGSVTIHNPRQEPAGRVMKDLIAEAHLAGL